MSSKTADVSPINNNKKNSDLLDNSMICDDASRTVCDVDGSKKQNDTNIILENKSEISLKNDTLSSEVLSICAPPKSKKRKLSSFDELIKKLDYSVLFTNLTQLLFFLESDSNKCVFLLTKNYEEFFEMIVQDINILKSNSLYDYRNISDKIIKAAAGKSLFYEFESKLGFTKKAMVINKAPIMDQSANSTASISCSSGSLMPPPQTLTKVDTNAQSRSIHPAVITTGFKIHCLRTLLDFIKNDAIKTKEFSELNTDQAKFVRLLLGKVNIVDFDNNCELEVQELYQTLVHAVKINELKCEFRIQCVVTSGGMKTVVFEKVPVHDPSAKSKRSVAFKNIPVHMSSGTALNSDQTAGMSKEMNPKTNIQNIGDPKPHAPNSEFLKPDTPKSHGPKMDVSKQDAPKSQDPKVDVLKPDASNSNSPKIEVLKLDAPKSNGPKVDVLKPDAPKSNDPKMDVSKQDALKSQDPKIDVPKPDASNSNGPKIDVSKQDAPKSQDPKVDVLKPDASNSNSPKIDVLKLDAPKSNGPKMDVSKQDAPKSQDPKVDVLKPDASNSNSPKIDVLKLDAPKSNGPKMDVSKQDAPKSQDPKIDVPKSDASNSNGPKIDVSKKDAPKSQDPKIDMLKPDAPKPQAPKTYDSGAPNTEPPQPDVAESLFEKPNSLNRTILKPKRIAKNALKKPRLYKNHLPFLKNMPKEFIEDALNAILDFLSNDNMVKLVIVPKTPSELKFYRRCIVWLSSGLNLSQFGKEFRELHCQITHLLCRVNVQVKKKKPNVVNEITGIKELTYLKFPKNSTSEPVTCTEANETSDSGVSQRTPKKPKVNVQKALQLAATDNIGYKLDKIINLNQSLRSKKKDKKRKKAKKAKNYKGASSSSATSRDSSRDRVKAAMAAAFVPQCPKDAKKPSSEISQSPKKTCPTRLKGETVKNENLIEAMSVQSNKATRMMLDMGWNGGALGLRGDGIIEPIMPAFEITRGAGFGLTSHRTQTKKSNPVTAPAPKKTEEPTSTPSTINDIVVKKTKQLLLEDVTFDTIMKRTEPAKLEIELAKPSKSTVELPTQTKFNITHKQENANLKIRLPFRIEFILAILELINSDATSKSLKYETTLNKKQRKFVPAAMQVLKGKKGNLSIFSREEISVCKQIREKYAENQFVVEARLFWDHRSIDLLKVSQKFNPPTHIVSEYKENTETITRNIQTMNIDNLRSYIIRMNGVSDMKAVTKMQFKVFFLINILNFVKSLNEEWELTINKVLNAKEKLYIEDVVDQVNMRIKFGSSPAETNVANQIREHVKDAFLGVMYDHDHTIITLSKYYRFRRLNRPDNAVKRRAQSSVNLDDFTIKPIIEGILNTDELIDEEIKHEVSEHKYEVSEDKYEVSEDKYEVSEDTNEVTGTDNTQVSTENMTTNVKLEISNASPMSSELQSYDSDDSSVEEYNNNNANATVPKLLPGEEGVNISNFLYLYDKEKTNAAGIRNISIINNDSASNVTENRNSKNNSGNGNVVIDNNDNQFIDMKRDGGNAQNTQKEKNVVSEKAEYVVCVDYKEEVIKSAEITIEIDRKEINLLENEDEENDQTTTKHSHMVVANDAKIVSDWEDIGDDDILQINDEVILNTEDLDPNVIVIKDSDSDNDCTENKAEDEIKNITENLPLEDFKGETVVTLNDIDAVKTMKIINITEESMEGIKTEPKHGIVQDDSNAVIEKDIQIAAINQDESKAVINIDDSMAIINIDDSVAIINLDVAVDVINKDKSKAVINTGETMAVIDNDESKAVIDIDDSMDIINLADAADVMNNDESTAVIDIDDSKAAVIQGKSKEVINKSEPMAVINQDESNAIIIIDDTMDIINLADAADVINNDEFNTAESSIDVKVAQIKEETSINPSDEKVVKDDLVIESECDRIKQENIVLSEEFCNTQSIEPINIKTVGAGTDFLYDKDSEIKTVRIGHTHHPIRKLSTEQIKKIQWHISNCMTLATEPPLLRCHGIQNGALFYTCHNKKTYDWLQNTIGIASYVKVCNVNEATKMALKLCGYFDFDSNYLFKMLEMYNKEISTKEWAVEKTEKVGNDIFFIVKMDKFSIKYIQESDLALFAGIDKVHFSLIWE